MSKVAKRHSKGAHKVSKRAVKPRALRKLQKTRPKRYMNPFLCFAHEERKKAKSGQLLPEWKAAHKGLGAKWRALGAGKSKFQRKGKVPAFAMFVKESPKRTALLPEWRTAHKGLGRKWKGMDKAAKAKYVTASKQMKGNYDQHMKVYQNKKHALVKSLAATRIAKRTEKRNKKMQRKHAKKMARIAKRTSRKKKKMQRRHAKKAKASRSKVKKTTKKKVKRSSRKGKRVTKRVAKRASKKN